MMKNFPDELKRERRKWRSKCAEQFKKINDGSLSKEFIERIEYIQYVNDVIEDMEEGATKCYNKYLTALKLYKGDSFTSKDEEELRKVIEKSANEYLQSLGINEYSQPIGVTVEVVVENEEEE